MFHQKSKRFWGGLGLTIASLGVVGLSVGRGWVPWTIGLWQGTWPEENAFGDAIPKANAHQVEIAGDVGGTIHIEPNDTPKSGEYALAWFALTTRGGDVIPLTDCDCHLDIYHAPYTPGDKPFSCPDLRAISSEGYEGIPGADVKFPEPGAYDVVVTGESLTAGAFAPFELVFSVTVAR